MGDPVVRHTSAGLVLLTDYSDAPGPEDWKKQLKIPAKDTRHQTEVRKHAADQI